jgi:hypothetical protein
MPQGYPQRAPPLKVYEIMKRANVVNEELANPSY